MTQKQRMGDGMIWGKIAVVLGLVLAAGGCWAAEAPAPSVGVPLFNRAAAVPDINTIPVLTEMARNGAKLFPMGERSGLFGWFVLKDGEVQMVYLAPDRKSVLIGGLFTVEGDNVTGAQITELVQTNKEVAALVNTVGRQQQDIAAAGVAGGAAVVPGQAPSGKMGSFGVPVSPGERLFQDLLAAGGVTVGHNENAQISMVVDLRDPRSLETWRELRESVKANRIQVRLIPVGNGDGEKERLAAQLLRAVNPLDAWEKHVDGDANVLAGVADPVRVQAVKANDGLMERWNIRATPYLVYRAKDGRIKIVQGKPERMAAVLSDLLQ